MCDAVDLMRGDEERVNVLVLECSHCFFQRILMVDLIALSVLCIILTASHNYELPVSPEERVTCQDSGESEGSQRADLGFVHFSPDVMSLFYFRQNFTAHLQQDNIYQHIA